jgi:hypothetical protein
LRAPHQIGAPIARQRPPLFERQAARICFVLGQCLFLSFSRCAGRKPSSPSQRGGGNVSTFSRRTPRPRFGYHHNNKAFLDSPPSPRKIMRNKEGGGAPKGASNHGRAISGARQRAKQPRPAQFRAPFACFAGARSPSGAPPRHFADCSAHLRAALPGITGCKREDPPRRQCSEHLAGRS